MAKNPKTTNEHIIALYGHITGLKKSINNLKTNISNKKINSFLSNEKLNNYDAFYYAIAGAM